MQSFKLIIALLVEILRSAVAPSLVYLSKKIDCRHDDSISRPKSTSKRRNNDTLSCIIVLAFFCYHFYRNCMVGCWATPWFITMVGRFISLLICSCFVVVANLDHYLLFSTFYFPCPTENVLKLHVPTSIKKLNYSHNYSYDETRNS